MPEFSLMSPVRTVYPDTHAGGLEKGIALCMSGGGYRAMLFHLGSIWRLNEAGVLPHLRLIASVSAGSITSALLGKNWKRLDWQESGGAPNFKSLIADPIRALADRSIDDSCYELGLAHGHSIHESLVQSFERRLFGQATLQNLPGDREGPEFIFNSTNVQTASLWRFSRDRMGDSQVGFIRDPTVSLAKAVACSSAPPAMRPAVLEVNPESIDLDTRGVHCFRPFHDEVILADGGFYDPLALETAFNRCTALLVSNAGQKICAEAEPKRDVYGHTMRMIGLVETQVRCLRKRQLLHALTQRERSGAFWGIASHFADYGVPDVLTIRKANTCPLATLSTRFKRIDALFQERLINWGYAICDAGLRKHCIDVFQREYGIEVKPPTALPYPTSAI